MKGPTWCLATREGKKFFRSVRMVNGGGVIEEAASVGVNCEVLQKELVGESLQFVFVFFEVIVGALLILLRHFSRITIMFWLQPKFGSRSVEQILGWWKEWGSREVSEGGKWGVESDFPVIKGGGRGYSPPLFSMVRNVSLSSLDENHFVRFGSLSTLLLRHLFSSSEEGGEVVVVCLSRVEEYGKVRGGGFN